MPAKVTDYYYVTILHLFIVDLELAIDPLPTPGDFVHYNFLKLHYIRNKMTHVSPLYVRALTCNVNVNYTTQNYIFRLRYKIRIVTHI